MRRALFPSLLLALVTACGDGAAHDSDGATAADAHDDADMHVGPDLTTGLLVFLPFGGSLDDASPNGFALDATRSTASFAAGHDGVADGALSETGCAVLDAVAFSGAAGALSLSVWLRPDTTLDATNSSDRKLIAGQESGVLAFFYRDGTLYAEVFGAAGGVQVGRAATTLAGGVWTHVALSVKADGSRLRIWQDGVELQVADGVVSSLMSATERMYFPCGFWASRFPGRLDDVRLYARALGDDEVAALHAP